jgi:hypothetical protein
MEREVRRRSSVPKLICKSGDLFADGRLTNPAFLCNRGEVPLFNYADEHLHCVEFGHVTLFIPLWNGFSGEE